MGDRLPTGMRGILGMRMGRDNVTEFINDMLYYQMIREQEEEEQGRRKKCSII